MSHAELHFRIKTASPASPIAARRVDSTRVLNCLIVAPASERRQVLLAAVARGGWDSIVCSDAESALIACQRTGFQMAIVDVQRCENRSAQLRDLCQAITSNKHVLLVVCGCEYDTEEEIWARQLGAWIYLPGMTGGDEFTRLCDEARLIADEVVSLD